jgi:hypothetical protein
MENGKNKVELDEMRSAPDLSRRRFGPHLPKSTASIRVFEVEELLS